MLYIGHLYIHNTNLFVSGTSAFTAKYNKIVLVDDVRFTDVLYNEGNDYNATVQQVYLLAEYQAFTGFQQLFMAVRLDIVTFYLMAKKQFI